MVKEIDGQWYKIVKGNCDDCAFRTNNCIFINCNIECSCPNGKCYKKLEPKYKIGDADLKNDTPGNVKIVSDGVFCKKDEEFIYLVKDNDGSVYHSNESYLKPLPKKIKVKQITRVYKNGAISATLHRADAAVAWGEYSIDYAHTLYFEVNEDEVDFDDSVDMLPLIKKLR